MGSDDKAIVGRNRYFAFCVKTKELANESGNYETVKFRMLGAELGLMSLLYEKVDRMTGRIELADIYRKILREDPKVDIDFQLKGKSVKEELFDIGKERQNAFEEMYVKAFNYAITVLSENQARHFLNRAKRIAKTGRDESVLHFARLLMGEARKDFNAEYFMEPESMQKYVGNKLGDGPIDAEMVKKELLAAYNYARSKPPKGRLELAADGLALFWGKVSRHKSRTAEMRAGMALEG